MWWGDLGLRNPITGIAGCCARAASGHVAAAPPSSVMKSRRAQPATTRPASPRASRARPRDRPQLPLAPPHVVRYVLEVPTKLPEHRLLPQRRSKRKRPWRGWLLSSLRPPRVLPTLPQVRYSRSRFERSRSLSSLPSVPASAVSSVHGGLPISSMKVGKAFIWALLYSPQR